MARKKHWPEEGVAKLRQMDALVSQGSRWRRRSGPLG